MPGISMTPDVNAAPGGNPTEGVSDEDFTRPPTRYDFRYNFQDKANGVEQSQFILRRDVTWNLGGTWSLGTRFDAPFVLSNATGSANPQGENRFNLGDILFQAVLINNPTDIFGYGAGMRAVFPTAVEDQLGSGKYRIQPAGGLRWKLPSINEDSYFQFITRYDVDVAGNSSRSHISQLLMSPTLNVSLPNHWFVTLFPSQDIALNTIRGHRWFVPADFSVGYNISKKVTTSLELSLPVVKQFTLYNFKLEARISIRL